MKRSIILLFAFLACTIIIPQTLWAQGSIDGFMKSKGETDIAFGYSWESYDKYYWGDSASNDENTTHGVNLFVAHGVEDRFNVVFSIPWIKTNEAEGIQDGSIYAKLLAHKGNLPQGSLNVIVASGFLFPLTNYNTSDQLNAIGSGLVAWENRLVVQYLHKNGMFGNATVGYNHRFNKGTGQAPLSVKAGWAHSNFYADLWLERQVASKKVVYDPLVSFNKQGFTYTRIGGTFYKQISPRWGGYLNGAKVFAGRNFGLASRVGLGIVFKLLPSSS